MITYKDALEMNESKAGLDLGEISLDNLLSLIEELPGWDYPLAEDLMHELAKRAGIDTDKYFAEADRDYSDLYTDATDKMSADTMEMMVADWIFDHAEEMDDLVLDGKPRYDEDLATWVQDAHDSTNAYLLVANGGNINIEYSGGR